MIDLEIIRKLYLQEKFSIREIAEKINIPFWSVYNFMAKNNIERRLPSEASYIVNKNKPKFAIKHHLNSEDKKLKVAGIMLYWAEGTFKGNTVDFANSNPLMVKVFLKFLREICGVSESRLRLYLYAYDNQNIEELKRYWSVVSGITTSQFTKPYVRVGNLNVSNRKLPYGIVHIRYNDKRLLVLIKTWIEEYCWAGTQAAKGGRLSNGSVLLKSRMEK